MTQKPDSCPFATSATAERAVPKVDISRRHGAQNKLVRVAATQPAQLSLPIHTAKVTPEYSYRAEKEYKWTKRQTDSLVFFPPSQP